MLEKDNHNLYRIQLTVTLSLILFLAVTGTTYAYYAFAGTNNNTFNGRMATADLSLSVYKIFPSDSVQNNEVMVPQLSDNAPLSSALRGGCVDGNLNVACQVYKIVVDSNGSNARLSVDGSISFYGNAAMTSDISQLMPNLRWRLVDSVDEVNANNSILGSNTTNTATSSDSTFVSNLLLDNSSVTYYIIVWIHETNNNQVDQSSSNNIKRFYGKVSFDASNGSGVSSYFG